jgi:predicted enzyme related to lactoylglutathione lyase
MTDPEVRLFVPFSLLVHELRDELRSAPFLGRASSSGRGGNDGAEGEVYALDLRNLVQILRAVGQRYRLEVVELDDHGVALGLSSDVVADGSGAAKVGRWDHTSLAVADLDKAVAFYCTLFGYETIFVERGMTSQIQSIVGQQGLECDLAQLRAPISNHVLELIAFRAPIDNGGPRPPTGRGQAHVAFTVASLELALERARSLGAAQLGGAVAFEEGRCVYMTEQAGTVFELCEPAPRV